MSTSTGAVNWRQNPYLIKIIRFTFGVTIALVLSSTFQWSLSFIAPLFVAMFLGPPSQPLTWASIRLITLGVAAVLSVGLLIAVATAHIPILCLLLVLSGLYFAYYLGNTGQNPLLVIMLMVGLSIIPMMGVNFRDLALNFTLGFVWNLFLALSLVWLCHTVFPNPISRSANKVITKPKKPAIDKSKASRDALTSTVILSPLLVYFYLFNEMSNVLVLCFAVLFLQNPTAFSSIKASLVSLSINTVACVYAAIIMVVLQMVPHVGFFTVVMAFVCLYFGYKIFLSANGAAHSSALNPILVLIGSTIVTDPSSFDDKLWLRLLQISCVPVYFAFAFHIARAFRPRAKPNAVGSSTIPTE
ncbi:DUF2955 domain-containing protein [Alginatibacterium sediminis]|uniref:DUF2955 domain-containing protein n=1 Tax=Alginatibacterium sediminis TaxID=2164068 RepID=A0A420EGF3_9ALTE|nr:DUF2955 domain-containing protein [Alginatibacterium sediminis]RKF19758.1 DUF2955 domain-containing protein [Alginatibacterium sediminis]